MKSFRTLIIVGLTMLTLSFVFVSASLAQSDSLRGKESTAKTPEEAEINQSQSNIDHVNVAAPSAVQIDCSGGATIDVYASDFESNAGGWSGNNDWEHGTPTYPAGLGANSGVNVWATKLLTDHTNLGDSSILSQTFDFSSVPNGSTFELSWAQHLEANGSGFDFASVKVNGDILYDSMIGGDDPVGYVTRTVDLSAYAGNPSVTIVFDFAATTVVNDPGWYIDDVAIQHCQYNGPVVELEKTVGTDPAICAATTAIVVGAGTDVTYCYSVTNIGTLSATLHDLVDSEIGTILSEFSFELAPATSIFVTQTVPNVQVDVTNVATWTAYNVGPTDVTSDTASATVTVLTSPLDVTNTGSGGTSAGENLTFTIDVTNPASDTVNGAATELTATLDISISNALDLSATVAASYYDTSAPSTLLGTLTEADLSNCVDAGDEVTPRDPFTNTPGQGVNGGPLAAGSIICQVDVSGFGDALIDTMDYRVAFQPIGASWDTELRVFFDAPPYDRSFGVNLGGYGAGAASAVPVYGEALDNTTLQGVPTGASAGTWEVFIFESFNDVGEDPDSVLITFTLDIYGWDYVTVNPTVSRVPNGAVTLPSVGIASASDFGNLLSPTHVEIVSQPDWFAVCGGTAAAIWQVVTTITDGNGLNSSDTATVSHAGQDGPGCDALSIQLLSSQVASPAIMSLLIATLFVLLGTTVVIMRRRT